MHLHILGICGTFMGGIALLARSLGHQVSGSDANVYPPMSTQLEEAGIELMEGYRAEHLQPAPKDPTDLFAGAAGAGGLLSEDLTALRCSNRMGPALPNRIFLLATARYP